MNNLFFKSPETYEKFYNKLDMILAEQRHQRGDLATIKRQLHTLVKDIALQKQVDEYFTKDEETSFVPLEDNVKDIPEEDL